MERSSFKHLPIIAIDTETTGFDVFDKDRIIEVGIVKLMLDENYEVVEREDYSQFVNPERDIPDVVTKLTGIKESHVKDAPTFAEIARDVHELLGEGILVAHNLMFDLMFLTEELKRCGFEWQPFVAEIDTVDLSHRVFSREKSHKLSDLVERCGVELVNAHRATDDAAACGLCLTHLMREEGLEDELGALLEWSGAVGRPPESAPFVLGEGGLRFADGPHEGERISTQPLYLSWMTVARKKTDDGWEPRFPVEVRAWVQRWIDVRGSGRKKMARKPVKPTDWLVDLEG